MQVQNQHQRDVQVRNNDNPQIEMREQAERPQENSFDRAQMGHHEARTEAHGVPCVGQKRPRGIQQHDNAPTIDPIEAFFAEIGVNTARKNRQNFTIHTTRAEKCHKPDPVPEMMPQQATTPTTETTMPTTMTDDESETEDGEDGDGARGEEDVEEAAATEVRDTETIFRPTIEHRRRQRGGRDNCRGCGIAFRVFADRTRQICYNCVRIIEAARNNATRTGGRIEVVVQEDVAFIKVICPKGHRRVNDFRPRQGQRPCRECGRERIAQEKERIRQEEEEEAQRRAAAQAEMFRQTQNQIDFFTIAAEAGHVNPNVQFIEKVIDAIVGQTDDTTVDPDDQEVQHRMVAAINQIGDDQIDNVVEAIFNRIPVDHQQRVERRVKFMIHPDKNTHTDATDAFKKWN